MQACPFVLFLTRNRLALAKRIPLQHAPLTPALLQRALCGRYGQRVVAHRVLGRLQLEARGDERVDAADLNIIIVVVGVGNG
jgi:hypothetical protein